MIGQTVVHAILLSDSREADGKLYRYAVHGAYKGDIVTGPAFTGPAVVVLVTGGAKCGVVERGSLWPHDLSDGQRAIADRISARYHHKGLSDTMKKTLRTSTATSDNVEDIDAQIAELQEQAKVARRDDKAARKADKKRRDAVALNRQYAADAVATLASVMSLSKDDGAVIAAAVELHRITSR